MEIKEIEYEYEKDRPFHAEMYHITRMEPHYHDQSIELICCLDGSVSFVAGMQSETLHAGQVFSIDCEDIHYLYSDEPNTVLLFHLDLKNLPIPWERLFYTFFACESTHCFSYQEKAMTHVKDLVLTLSHYYFADYGHETTRELISSLLDTLFRYFNYYNYDNQDAYMNPELFERFYSILTYCIDNFQDKITLEMVAEHTHISKNYVSQYFSQTSFGSFSSMMKEIRCFRAERLFLTTNLPNTEISYTCGFSDPKYMYAAFRELWGCTPKEHRGRYKKYMQDNESVTVLTGEESLTTIEKEMVKWHIKKSQLHVELA